MTGLIASVLAASLLGSAHCAGMCGGFLAFAVGVAPGSAPSLGSMARLQACYHAGRLLTYTTLGAIAGALGSVVDLGGSLAGVQRTAMIGAGAFISLFGLVALLRLLGAPIRKARAPRVLQQISMEGHRRALALSPMGRALAVGLLTTLLPCGWLYAFVVVAAGTGRAEWGAATMGAFWVGTLPLLAALGAGVQTLAGPLGRRAPLLTTLALVAVGLYTMSGRSLAHLPRASNGADVSSAATAERVRALANEEPSCCKP